jgi:transcriptional regulator with XRE-family HTH domain
MDYNFIRRRITELRLKKGVSEYLMSLDLGHSRSYIQNIASGRSKPSIEEFLYMCEYLSVTPKAFFDESEAEPILIQKALDGMRTLSDKDMLTLIGLIDRLKEEKR